MDFTEIQELAKILNKFKLAEIRVEKKDGSITVKSDAHAGKKTATEAVIAQTVETGEQSKAPSKPTAEDNEGTITVKSPMIGTFYRRPSPDKDVFINVGDTIKNGDVLCIIEAMKLFNEIESEISGKIVKILVDDSTPVEYDQPLFLVDPNG